MFAFGVIGKTWEVVTSLSGMRREQVRLNKWCDDSLLKVSFPPYFILSIIDYSVEYSL